MSDLSQRQALFDFFVYSNLSPELPTLPVEIKLIISGKVLSCLHGCSKAMWGKFNRAKAECCFCSDKRPVQEIYTYKDCMGEKTKTKERWLQYCIICKRLAEKGQGPK